MNGNNRHAPRAHASRARARHALARSVAALAVAVVVAACYDKPIGPDERYASGRKAVSVADRAVDMGSCDSLSAPAGSSLEHEMYGDGVQIYRWDGTSWGFVAPRADLFADEGEHALIVKHSGDPTWTSKGGSTVVGTVMRRCTPNANAIPWLLLSATPGGETGIFERTKYIQRAETVGGLAPKTAGLTVGEVREVPYTAVYRFFRAE